MTYLPLATVLTEAIKKFGRYDVPDGAYGFESPNRDYFDAARAVVEALESGTDPNAAVGTPLPQFVLWFADRCEHVWHDPDLATRLRTAYIRTTL